jgi:hypothetical protein
MIKKKIIQTNNKEIYNKLKMLHFTNEVLLNNVKDIQISRILKNINSDSNIISIQKIGDYFVLKKLNPLNFEIYLK